MYSVAALSRVLICNLRFLMQWIRMVLQQFGILDAMDKNGERLFQTLIHFAGRLGLPSWRLRNFGQHGLAFYCLGLISRYLEQFAAVCSFGIKRKLKLSCFILDTRSLCPLAIMSSEGETETTYESGVLWPVETEEHVAAEIYHNLVTELDEQLWLRLSIMMNIFFGTFGFFWTGKKSKDLPNLLVQSSKSVYRPSVVSSHSTSLAPHYSSPLLSALTPYITSSQSLIPSPSNDLQPASHTTSHVHAPTSVFSSPKDSSPASSSGAPSPTTASNSSGSFSSFSSQADPSFSSSSN
ncbi:unnamed protein product [Vicia faba]|uniref:Uncharacterized protein n=1 Tax=Vicia faba TaxID=3906 RepID=A0AAV1B1J5_VICFA|nr:unnamed protein product [Vicia faba]